MEEVFDFEHINLIPKKCIVDSRSECDTSVQFGKHTFKLPIIPANMECVINEEIAENLAKNGYFYVMHRFGIDNADFIRKMKAKGLIASISIGVNQDSYELLDKLRYSYLIPDYITIDIAHGHAVKMERMIKYIRSFELLKDTFIIAGNVCTPEAVKDLSAWGANAIKCGVGPGKACTTYMMTGFGSRGNQASMIQECAKVKPDGIYLIADGGIQTEGDISKAITLGADMIMAGGMFSGLVDSPGNIVSIPDGKSYKEYWGSASEHQSGKSNRIEGTKKLIPLQNKNFLTQMNFIQESLQSSISYGGGKTLQALKTVKYILKKL
jgi:GMP reductase